MSDTARLSADGKTLTVRVPLQLKRRGGRKVVVAPDGHEWPLATPKPHDALIKALARAFRWQRMLESGEHATIAEVARSEGVGASFVARSLQLTLVAPDIVEKALNDQSGSLTLGRLTKLPFPVWKDQRESLENSRGHELINQ